MSERNLAVCHRGPIACLLFAAPLICGGCQVASQGMNASGTRYYQQGNYQAAAARFQQAIANDPESADGYYNIAATYHRLAKLTGDQTNNEQAEHFYNQCLDRDPDHTECHRGLAVLLVETNRPDAAQRLLENWSTASPTNPDARIELARLKDEFGEPDAAKEHLLQALSVDPQNSRALTALGKLRDQSGDHSQALANYQRSLAANRFQPQVATRVAALQSAIGHSPLTTAGTTRVVAQPQNATRY